jgi:hypothetical protein
VDVTPIAPQAPEIVDALLGLWQQAQRHRKERMQQQAPEEQAPATGHDPGWEF